MQLVLATNNADKLREIRGILDDLPVTTLSKSDFLEFPDPQEIGSTLEENSLLKARAVFDFTGFPSLADDSGLEVDALGGAPGVYSSRFAGPKATYKDNCNKLLLELAGVPIEKRTARFRCVMTIYWAANDVDVLAGTVEGRIATTSEGNQGFGYDPVFVYPPLNRRFSELSLEEKNSISHRGRALLLVRHRLMERLKSTRNAC